MVLGLVVVWAFEANSGVGNAGTLVGADWEWASVAGETDVGKNRVEIGNGADARSFILSILGGTLMRRLGGS